MNKNPDKTDDVRPDVEAWSPYPFDQPGHRIDGNNTDLDNHLNKPDEFGGQADKSSGE